MRWSRLSKRFSKHYMILALVFPHSWKINSYWWREYKLYKQCRDLWAGTVLTAPSLRTSFPGTRKCYIYFQRRESNGSLIQQWCFWAKQWATTFLPSNDTYGPQQWATLYNNNKNTGARTLVVTSRNLVKYIVSIINRMYALKKTFNNTLCPIL